MCIPGFTVRNFCAWQWHCYEVISNLPKRGRLLPTPLASNFQICIQQDGTARILYENTTYAPDHNKVRSPEIQSYTQPLTSSANDAFTYLLCKTFVCKLHYTELKFWLSPHTQNLVHEWSCLQHRSPLSQNHSNRGYRGAPERAEVTWWLRAYAHALALHGSSLWRMVCLQRCARTSFQRRNGSGSSDRRPAQRLQAKVQNKVAVGGYKIRTLGDSGRAFRNTGNRLTCLCSRCGLSAAPAGTVVRIYYYVYTPDRLTQNYATHRTVATLELQAKRSRAISGFTGHFFALRLYIHALRNTHQLTWTPVHSRYILLRGCGFQNKSCARLGTYQHGEATDVRVIV